MTASTRDQVVPGRSRLVRLTGELHVATVPTARRRIWHELQPSGSLIVDLEGVTFIDSAGLALLLTLHREVTRRGGRWALVGSSAPVARMLAVTQADRMLPLFPSLADLEREWSDPDDKKRGRSLEKTCREGGS